MNRISRNDFSFRADEDDEESLYERQALIYDNDSICDDETNLIDNGQKILRHRQQSDKDGQVPSNNGYELRNLNGKTTRDPTSEPGVEFTYYDIKPGDSLQSICLRYTCPVTQVKRLNGLMADQDFYGLRRLKLPLGKLGLLEDILKRQQENSSNDLLMLEENQVNHTKPRIVNSPGSALSVTDKQSYPRYKPLLSPGYSCDRVNELNKHTAPYNHVNGSNHSSNGQATLHHNSRSFSSLRELANGDTNIDISNPTYAASTTLQLDPNGFKTSLQQKNFIKSDLMPDPSQITIDNMLTDDDPIVTNIFEDLDYHVERAKAAAETYEKRTVELVSGIDVSCADVDANAYRKSTASKIPELFFSGENFGLNLKKLVILIFFVCLVIPLVYMSQTDVIK